MQINLDDFNFSLNKFPKETNLKNTRNEHMFFKKTKITI